MATYFLDYEGGSDAADGLSFANRWKTFTLGATAARIAPGDTIRVMGSPAPTSLGITGAWTNRVGGLAPTQNIVSSTNAVPIVVTLTGHGYSNGDTLIITGHTTNTNGNGTWEIANVAANTFELVGSTGNGIGGADGTVRLRNNSVVRLASALTQNIASFANRGEGRVAWTASANVTCTLSTTDFKCADVSDEIAVATGFGTGLAAYFPTGTLDLSSKQQVSFWIKQTAGAIGLASSTSLTLCSDAAGATPVNTVNIPAFAGLARWMPVTIDIGSALGASIQSIGFVINTDNGNQTFLISNMLACKASSSADSLTLTSLIGKNTAGETWYGLQSINGTRVMLDMHTNCLPTTTTWRGWSGVSETVVTWKREAVVTGIVASGAVNSVQDSGVFDNFISFEGGWDRADMTTQTLDTWFDGRNGRGIGISLSSKNFVSLNKISAVRYSSGIQISGGVSSAMSNVSSNNNDSGIELSGSYAGNISIDSASSNSTSGLSLAVNYANRIDSLGIANNNGSNGVHFVQANNNAILEFGNVLNNQEYGLNFLTSNLNTVRNGVAEGNLLGGISNGIGVNYLRNFTFNESTEVSGFTDFANSRIFSEKHDGIADNHQIFTDGGLIRSEGTVRHTASVISWALLPTSTNRSATYPLDLSIAKVACKANLLVTFKAWLRRSDTGLTLRLNCKGGQLSGIPSDVTASMSAAADTWEEVTITFTPTEQGVVEITAEAWGGTTFIGYVDDISVTQA